VLLYYKYTVIACLRIWHRF